MLCLVFVVLVLVVFSVCSVVGVCVFLFSGVLFL